MMTDNEVLAADDCAHTAHPDIPPTAIRNAGSSFILTDPMLIVRTLKLRRQRRGSATDGPHALAFSFAEAGRERDGRLPATRLPRFAPSSRRV
jgi:hypothetical protein